MPHIRLTLSLTPYEISQPTDGIVRVVSIGTVTNGPFKDGELISWTRSNGDTFSGIVDGQVNDGDGRLCYIPSIVDELIMSGEPISGTSAVATAMADTEPVTNRPVVTHQPDAMLDVAGKKKRADAIVIGDIVMMMGVARTVEVVEVV